MPHGNDDDAESVLFNEIPKAGFFKKDEKFIKKWEQIHALRDDVKKALEIARADKLIGSSLDAQVILHCRGEILQFVNSISDILPAVLIVSQVTVLDSEDGDFAGEVEGLRVTVKHANGHKCARCWTYSKSVGTCAKPDLCSRCCAIVG